MLITIAILLLTQVLIPFWLFILYQRKISSSLSQARLFQNQLQEVEEKYLMREIQYKKIIDELQKRQDPLLINGSQISLLPYRSEVGHQRFQSNSDAQFLDMTVISLNEKLMQKQQKIEQIQLEFKVKDSQVKSMQKQLENQKEQLKKYELKVNQEQKKYQEMIEEFQEAQVKLQLFKNLSNHQINVESQLELVLIQLGRAQKIINEMEFQIKSQEDKASEKEAQLQDKQELLIELQLELEKLKYDTSDVKQETTQIKQTKSLDLQLQRQNQEFESIIRSLKDELEQIRQEKEQL